MSSFKCDVFISYSSTDAEWAAKLEVDLIRRGLKVFRDKTRLQLGDRWSQELKDSVRGSQHMISLWSDAAAKSEWANLERAMFLLIEPSNSPRRLIGVTLEGSSPVLAELQTFNDLKTAGCYARGAAAVDPVLWGDLLTKVVEAVKADQTTVPITTLVFTITKAELEAMNPVNQLPGSTLEELLQDFAVGGPQPAGNRRDLLLPYYGVKREDWKPFGQDQLPIRTVLAEVFVDLNKRLESDGVSPTVRFHMEWVGDDFWDDKNARTTYLAEMRHSLTLLVIDAVPLCDLRYQYLFDDLKHCLVNELAAVVVLPPFPSTQQSARLHGFLRDTVKKFADFYRPPIPATPKYAQFGLHANDGSDIGRLIQQSVGHYVRAQQPALPANPYTRLA